MCGRYAHISLSAETALRLGIDSQRVHAGDRARYNQPPGEFVPVALAAQNDPERLEIADVYWGFTPSWANKASQAQINARSETAATKPFWRKAFRRRRCVIAADLWYEWQRHGERKQPYAIRPAGGARFVFAGLWSVARNLPARHKASGRRTFAIVTTAAAPDIAHIHPRMPVALTLAGALRWLADAHEDTATLHKCLAGARHAHYESWPVPARVGNPRNDDDSVLQPVA